MLIQEFASMTLRQVHEIVDKETQRSIRRCSVRTWAAGAALATLLALPGCTLLEKTVEFPLNGMKYLLLNSEKKAIFDPVELQEDLLRFADNLTSASVGAALQLRKDGQPISRRELLVIWISITSDVLATATGSNALGDLVDMIVLTAVGRMRIEEYWMPTIYGESAKAMRETFADREKQIWALADRIMSSTQKRELRASIEEWRQRSKEDPSVLNAFASISLVSEITRAGHQKAASKTSSVFSLLDLDPLAGLDPATRELAQTRLLAERAIFIGQRMPQILQWQAELLAIRAAEMPQVEQMVKNSTEYAVLGGRIGKLAEQVPALVDAQRRELFKDIGQQRQQVFQSIGLERNEILKGVGLERAEILRGIGIEREKLVSALQSQTPALAGLSRDVGQAFGEGARMAASTDSALKSFSGVMAEINKPSGKAEPPQKEPFRIQDYSATAQSVGDAVDRINTLLASLQPLISPENLARIGAQVHAITAATEARGQNLVDYVFRRILQLMFAGAGLIVASGLAFRFLSQRLFRAH